MAYIIEEVKPEDLSGGQIDGLTPMSLRGAVRELWRSKGREYMVSGPAETGKTIGCLLKVNALAWKYPRSRGVICRKVQKSMVGTVIQSWEHKILGQSLDSAVRRYGGEKPEFYDYPNGSRIWVVGLDNADKILSGEIDFAYVNQAEETTLDDWEKLLTRVTGRSGHMPYAQLFGDCNPGPSFHWIKQRFGSNLLESRHEDNPTLFNEITDEDGTVRYEITEQGRRTLETLDSLTGVRYLRLRLGRWASSEGLVLGDFDPAYNVISRADVPECHTFIELADFGYTNPFCWERWAIDNDLNAYLTHEIYWTMRLVEDHVREINRMTAGLPRPDLTICDHDAEDRATYEKYRRVRTVPALKEVGPGIQDLQQMIRLQGNGKPRLYICREAREDIDPRLQDSHLPTSSLEEVEGYSWNELKDRPVKLNDHGMDLWRYLARHMNKKRLPRRRIRSLTFGGFV